MRYGVEPTPPEILMPRAAPAGLTTLRISSSYNFESLVYVPEWFRMTFGEYFEVEIRGTDGLDTETVADGNSRVCSEASAWSVSSS